MRDSWDIAIIGGGAAGMMAAIMAGRTARDAGNTLRIGLLDGAKKLGAKILVAGGGRCNVTHRAVSADDFAGGSRNTINRILRSFTVEQTVSFFEDLGVRLKIEETGKLFPVTDSAHTVLNALMDAVRDAGAAIVTDCRVHGVAKTDDGFTLDTSQGSMDARRLIIATGGQSLPKTGSDGAGYNFAKAIGHTVTPIMPALVPLILQPGHFITQLSGTSADVELTVARSTGKVIKRMTGAMLCTHFGISGPVVLDISRYWVAAKHEGDAPSLRVNFLPGETFEVLDKLLVDAAQCSPRKTLMQLLQAHTGVSATERRTTQNLVAGAESSKPRNSREHRAPLPERLLRQLIERHTKGHAGAPVNQLSREQRRLLVRALCELDLPVVGDRGYKFAEVTAGGVPLDEVNAATMASRRCDGLYLCGEILDADGRVGGFNFQWAWCTGRLTGLAAAKELNAEY